MATCVIGCGSNESYSLAYIYLRFASGLDEPWFGASHRLQETEMSSLKNGIGHRVTLMISDWLVLNTNELTWIALIGGGVLLVGFSMT